MKINIIIFIILLFLVVVMKGTIIHAQGYFWYPLYYSFMPYYYSPFETVIPVRTAQTGLTTLLLLSALSTSSAATAVSPTIIPTYTPIVTATPTIGTLTTLVSLLGGGTSTLGTVPITTIPVI